MPGKDSGILEILMLVLFAGSIIFIIVLYVRG
jgi:hypothetical protein